MNAETKVKLTSPSGDEIDVVWTGDRLVVMMLAADRSIMSAYDSHSAKIIEKELLEEKDT